MPDTTSRYSQVTRRAFLGGLSVAAIATVAACSSTSSTSSSSASSSSSSSSSSTTGASAAATGPALPATAKATVAWTFASTSGQKNPYMAVWIEDANGSFVKTLALYHKANGDNWLNTLTRWYSVSGGATTTTSGTVPAGSFTTSWDGSTASGARAVQGNYYVCVESVVEHGSESLVRQQVAFATTAAKTTLTAAGAITAASVDYTV